MTLAGLLGSAAAGAAATGAAHHLLTARPPGGLQRWARTNHRREAVTRAQGPAIAAGLQCCSRSRQRSGRLRAAGLVAAVGAGFLGAYDDLAGCGDSRGLSRPPRGVAAGEVTTGPSRCSASARGAGRRSPARAVPARHAPRRRGRRGHGQPGQPAGPAPRARAQGGLLTGPARPACRRTGTWRRLPPVVRRRAARRPRRAGHARRRRCQRARGRPRVVRRRPPPPRRRLAVRLTGLVALTAASERVSFTAGDRGDAGSARARRAGPPPGARSDAP